jgi:phenylacetate-CoA ligase
MNITNIMLNLKWKKFSKKYNDLVKNQYLDYERIQSKQLVELKELLKHAIKNIDYYKNYNISSHTMNLESISLLLERFPIINKQIIKENSSLFQLSKNILNEKIFKMTTGGSTGVPLAYYMNYTDMMYSRLLKYRGFSMAGYKIGDPLMMIGGGSLVNKPTLASKIKMVFLRSYKFSSYKLNDNTFNEMIHCLRKEKKVFLYGYASSIYLFSLFIIKNNHTFVKNKFMGVFPTSEVLHDFQRHSMMEAFGNIIFDDYGVNDGGVSAHECEKHNGLHIDSERSVVEVINENDNHVKEGQGRLVVTSLRNFTMPFIRYETGDIVEVTNKPCSCGRTTPRITKIYGRTTDYLKIENDYIGSPVLTVLMGKLDIDLYQIIQKNKNKIEFRIYKTMGLTNKLKKNVILHINQSILSHYKSLEIDILFYDEIPNIDNKYKYIINETKDDDNHE